MKSTSAQSPSGLPGAKKRHFEIRRLTKTPRALARRAVHENETSAEALLDYRVIGPQVRRLIGEMLQRE